ncbi:hypothetical protein BYT27DRAFT_7188951 [Phlegmacium glaucopus]|nr:hypothetical protein BYT27DRAFT_7188951 [Phlegmacium glaucopus]
MSSEPPATKGKKIKQVLKSAALLPVRVTSITSGRGTGRNSLTPRPGEPPVVIFRLQVLGCSNLLAKDRGGTSDPFVVVSILHTKQQTSVAKRTLNPIYTPKDATFDFPIYLSLADKLGVVELVVWDKDMLTKDYLGEVALPLEDWFVDKQTGKERPFDFSDPGNQPISLNLVSTRASTPSTGSIQIKLGFVPTSDAQNLMEYDEIFTELNKRSRPSLVSAAPTEGVGTVRSHHLHSYDDDGGLSSDSGNSDDEAEFTDPQEGSPPASKPALDIHIPNKPPQLVIQSSPNPSPATPTPGNLPTPTPTVVEPTPKASSGFSVPTPRFMPKMKFGKKFSGLSPAPASPALNSPAIDAQGTLVSPAPSKKKFVRKWSSGSGSPSTSTTGSGNESSNASSTKSDFKFEGGNDIVGIVMLEIQSASDLPRLANMTRTGWDMDPFVVISFGKKVFRTRVIRHSRNPVWDEKLLFHVRRYETAFQVQLTILDWDKLSSNDHIGDASFSVKDLVESAPQRDPATGLYSEGDDGDHPMTEYKLQLSTAKEMPWEAKHNPVITFRAKYQPYDALRQHFWRQYLKQYDTDDTNTMSHLELTSMLDSLGSTLTRSTVSSFFTRFDKKAHQDEITIDQAIQCLETELGRPDSEKKRLDVDDGLPDTSVSGTPVLSVAGDRGQELQLDQLDFSGPSVVVSNHDEAGSKSNITLTEPMQLPVPVVVLGTAPENSDSWSDDAEGDLSSTTPSPVGTPPQGPSAEKKKKMARFRRTKKVDKAKDTNNNNTSDDTSQNASDSLERVINVKNCPLCHRPRLNSKAEIDIITHLAVCASQDWNKVDRIVVGNFVTASQAQRKWYTNVIAKVSSGDYKLGANSANIIVQNRITGQLEEEKMQVYVRLGIRLLYKGATSRMEGGRARRLLKSLSIKQGIKYDAPESAQDIAPFIAFHGLSVDEILDSPDSFKTFNEFFYRKLKPSARPVEAADDPYRLVSAADCRLMTFETVSEATRLWIKGREFSVARLLGAAYKGQAEKYNGGALAIFRLAPQDYHRFHSPVDGTIGPMTYISGEYYTVNPQAIRSTLDVYGENVRKIVPIDSPQFGRVMAVCVGAMMVGSIKTTVEEGESVQRGQEFGYFAFGGSTIVVLFEKGMVQWDEDLLINGHASLETLVRVGMGIGRGRTNPA